MLDARIRLLIDPALNVVGRTLSACGVTANTVTLVGLGFGALAAVAIALGVFWAGLILLLVSRIADGLDGAVARASVKTDFGGYLDIACDFLFYGLIPMAFVWYDPTGNGAAGAWLLTSFYFNGASFLGYAILADRYGKTTSAQGQKSLYYSNGILEGAETIVFFVLLCLFPTYFVIGAWVFGGLCFLTASLRLRAASLIFLLHTKD
jgi:phosphatidylglycerophosphate synthase